jgi:uncharacterized membrane protein YdjX (TVP38/TMEM64 family)
MRSLFASEYTATRPFLFTTLPLPRHLVPPRWLRWSIVAFVAIAVIVYFAMDGRAMLNLDTIKSLRDDFNAAYSNRPIAISLAYFALFALLSALSLPGAAALMLISGSTMGLVYGTFLSTLASAFGALLAMWGTRALFRDAAQARFQSQLETFESGISRDGLFYLFALRVAPVIPYFILNWIVGLTQMRAWPFFWVSFLGMIPGTALYVNAGRELGQLQSFSDLFSASVLASLAAIALIPLTLRWLYERFVTPQKDHKNA